MRQFIFVVLMCYLPFSAWSQAASVKQQSHLIDSLLADRLNHLLPQLMDETGIDCWLIISREYNEDPVLKTMLPSTWLSARRTTMLVFFRDKTKNNFEKLAIARYDVGGNIKAAWDQSAFPNQWEQLAAILQSHNPKKIGINLSKNFGHADGLVHTDYQELTKVLPFAQLEKLVSAEPLAVAWLETRTAAEMAIYPALVQATHDIIAEGFSTKVIQPGITGTDDVVWWFREKIRSLGYDTWFHPTVSLQRNDTERFDHLRTFSKKPEGEIIQYGDLLHVDIGISYLRLHTDIQQHAYVCKPGETEAPQDLVKALAIGNRLQDILTGQFVTGNSGNTLLSGALAQAKKEGIEAVIYSHPIGFHGHAAGPTIGLWDKQEGVPGSGDYRLRSHTAYSIELNAAVFIPLWQKKIRIMLEEDGYYENGKFQYINQRQTRFLLVK